MNRIIIAIISVLILTGCHKNDNPEPTPEPETTAQRTVLVYISGENNLSEDTFLEEDIQEMLKGSYNVDSKQHFIAFIDSVGKNNTPHIVEIADGKMTEVYRYDSEFYASDPEKFSEVIQWTIDNYPAKEYGLVLWGHATGWTISNDTIAQTTAQARYIGGTRAYGYDKGTDDMSWASSKWMNITQMARALESLPHLKFIFADCCCFQCLESAYELRKTADYLIGSPAEIPGEGAPYDVLVPLFFSQSSTFYNDICDEYYKYYLEGYQKYSEHKDLWGYSVPMSVIDLNQMDALAEATAKIMQKFVPQAPDELDLTGLPFYFGYDRKVMYDTKAVLKTYAPAADYAEWLTAYDKAVPYQLVSRKWMTEYSLISNSFGQFPTDETLYGCTSMFFPQSTYSTATYRYNQRIKQLQWYYAVNWGSYGW